MHFESFLNRWYDIRREDVLQNNIIDLSINKFPGNLQKNLNYLRYYFDKAYQNYGVTSLFYSLDKFVFFRYRFFYFDFIGEIVDRIITEMPHIKVGTSLETRAIDNFNQVLEYRVAKEYKTNNFVHEIGEFVSNGSFKLKLFPLEGQFTLTDKVYLDDIYNQAFVNMLHKLEEVMDNTRPIYTYEFVVQDKNSLVNDFTIALDFYHDHTQTNLNSNVDVEELENIHLILRNDCFNTFNREFNLLNGSGNYNHSSAAIECKKLFVKFITDNMNIQLFRLNTGDDFSISPNINSSNYRNGDKVVLNSGNISNQDFKIMASLLKDDETFSSLLLKSIS